MESLKALKVSLNYALIIFAYIFNSAILEANLCQFAIRIR